MGGNDAPASDEDDIVGTAINIIRSDAVLAVRDRTFGFFREKTSTAFSRVRGGGDSQRVEEFNLEVLESLEQEVKLVERGDEIPPFQTVDTEDSTVVELNLDAFKKADRDKILNTLVGTYEAQGRLLTHEQELEFEVIEDAEHNARNREILNHFEQYLSYTQLQLLRRSLSIRTAWEMENTYIPNEKINEWKWDLRKKFGESAGTVANFCSSGYYDEGGILRELMFEVAADCDQEYHIEKAYDQIVAAEPFVVYVGGNDEAWERSATLRNKLKKHHTYSYSIPYIDLRARGHQNKKTANKAMEDLLEDLPDLEYEELHPHKELVYRIDTSSVKETD